MTKNPKKSTFLLRVEKSGVVPYGVRVKIKESVQNQLDGQRLTINAQGSLKVFWDVGFVSFEGHDWDLNAGKILFRLS